jgi:hypothetical protein
MTDQVQVNTLETISEQIQNILQLTQAISDQIQMIPANRIYIVNGLSDINGNLGTIVAGEFRAGVGNPGKTTDKFTGVRMAYPGMAYNSQSWNIVGVAADVMQFGLNAADGKAYAGMGSVILDSNGISLITSGVATQASSLNFVRSSTGIVLANIAEYYDPSIGGYNELDIIDGYLTKTNSVIKIQNQGVDFGYSGTIQIDALYNVGTRATLKLYAVSTGTLATITADKTLITGKLNATLSVYANNAAAIAGGLVVGDFYRTGSDPDAVSVVH